MTTILSSCMHPPPIDPCSIEMIGDESSNHFINAAVYDLLPPLFLPSSSCESACHESSSPVDNHAVENHIGEEDEFFIKKYCNDDDNRDEHESPEDIDGNDNVCWGTYGRSRPKVKFPPPLPFLARTGKSSSQLPWELKRVYREDGSLVIYKVTRSTHHEYFRARRSCGRLTLQMMSMNCSSSSPMLFSCPKEESGDNNKLKEKDNDDYKLVTKEEELTTSSMELTAPMLTTLSTLPVHPAAVAIVGRSAVIRPLLGAVES